MEHGTDNPGEQPQTPTPEQGPQTTPPIWAGAQLGAPATARPSLVFPIIATVLFWPVGLFAILKTVKAKKAVAAGDNASAVKLLRTAKTESIIATIVGGLILLCNILILAAVVASAPQDLASQSPTKDEIPSYSASMADGPTNKVVIRLTVDKGSARSTFSGTLGGKEFENADQSDNEFKKSFTKTILVDKDSKDFTIDVLADTYGAKVTCELEVDGVVVGKNVGTGTTYCDMYMTVNDDSASADDASSNDSSSGGIFAMPKYAVGDCINTTTNAGGQVTSEKVDCAGEHDGQVTHVETLPDGDYPGEEAISNQANTVCTGDAFTSFIGIPFTDSTLSGSFMYPQSVSWTVGDRDITCLVHEAEGKTTGSLQGAAR
ncbi:hypothetical protein G7068_09955 [Leucobacter viscericola]|uniref:Septum formation-related domain-containing protein n=1 Tax=Leucobacter viscericola TaxID=2714935 RepID=A0A6G7XG88_9MICO|nr:septum formation family protein [Leucobacter viscericola]QIK63486.1 hypothetical protein G7068_09955 [Leucobacter viscericola]